MLAAITAAAAALAMAPAGASASSTGSSDISQSFIAGSSLDRDGQTFTVPAGADNFLYELEILSYLVDKPHEIEIYATSAGLPTGAPLWTSPTLPAQSTSGARTVYPNLVVSPGTMYALAFGATPPMSMRFRGTLGNPYAGGTLVSRDATAQDWGMTSSIDLGFRAEFNTGQAVTQTALSCPSMTIGVQSSCTATVQKRGSGVVPQGQVDFTSGGGTFGTGDPCTLDGVGTCQVQFTPSSASPSITANYAGNATNLASSATSSLTADKRNVAFDGNCAGTVKVGVAADCLVDVEDNGAGATTNPTGSITLSSNLAGSFSPGTNCPLVAAGADAGRCAMSFTPTEAGTASLSATYGGDSTHSALGPSNVASVVVTKRASVIESLTCAPDSLKVGQVSTCTVDLGDTDVGTQTTPAGNVTFSKTGGGTLSSTTCAVNASGVCSVDYTPAATGSFTITASYAGDSIHNGATDANDAVSVGKRDSVIADLTCTPDTLTVGQASTCTVSLDDTDAGTPTTPTGDVTFTKTGGGTFSSTTCTVDAAGACSVGYTPGAAGSFTVTASYAGDSVHNAAATADTAVSAQAPAAPPVNPPAETPATMPPDCSKLRAKLRKQKGNLKRADTAKKRNLIGGNIRDSKRRIAKRGCAAG